MSYTHNCMMTHHHTKCLYDYVTHLLLQVGAAPDQVPVGPFYTLTVAGWSITKPSVRGTMLHTYYCKSVRHQTKCLWDYVTHLLLQVGAAPDQVPVGPCFTLTIAGRSGTRPSTCGIMLHTYYCRSVQHQTKCLWDHVTHTLTIAGRSGTRPSACGTRSSTCSRGIPTSQSVARITRIGGDRPIRHLSAVGHNAMGGVWQGRTEDYWKYMGRYHCEKMNLQ